MSKRNFAGSDLTMDGSNPSQLRGPIAAVTLSRLGGWNQSNLAPSAI